MGRTFIRLVAHGGAHVRRASVATLLAFSCAVGSRLGPPAPDDLERQRLSSAARIAVHITVVGSMPLRLLTSPATHLVRTVRQMLHLPLVVLYDPDPEISIADIPSDIFAEDIFVAIPSLRIMVASGSPIDRLYAWVGFRERFDSGNHGVQAAKLLVRKVATIHFAVTQRIRSGHILWADSDVEFLRPLDAAFFDFIQRYDVAYVPFKGPGGFAARDFTRGYADGCWWVESGVMALAVNEHAAALAAAAVELYEGGLLRLWDRCRVNLHGNEDDKPLCPQFVRSSLYANDVYIWSIVTHLAGYAATEATRSALTGAVCCLDKLSLLRRPATQGWFPFHTSTLRKGETNFTAPWRLDYYAAHHIVGDGALTQQYRAAIQQNVSLAMRKARSGTTSVVPRVKDPALLSSSVNISAWRARPWNASAEDVVPLLPRIALCGCTHSPQATHVRATILRDPCPQHGAHTPHKRTWQRDLSTVTPKRTHLAQSQLSSPLLTRFTVGRMQEAARAARASLLARGMQHQHRAVANR